MSLKKILPVLPALFLVSSCLPSSVDSTLDACPPEGLQSTSFHDGKPPEGTLIRPSMDDKGDVVWNFSSVKDAVYVTCRYDSGVERLQKLPDVVKSCKTKPTGGIFCKSSL